MSPLPALNLTVSYAEFDPGAKAELSFHEFEAGILAWLVLTASAVVGRDLCRHSLSVDDTIHNKSALAGEEIEVAEQARGYDQ